VGAVATLVDVCILLVCVKALHLITPVSAMIGVLVGSTLTFFLNRHFAFRDKNPQVAHQAVKFATATGVCMLIHGGMVGVLTDRLGVPVVVSKLIADICVFSVGQLLVLRYLVFPKNHGQEVKTAVGAPHDATPSRAA
jgi:putative flippase GtrA